METEERDCQINNITVFLKLKKMGLHRTRNALSG